MTLTNRWPLVVSALPFNIMLSHKCVPDWICGAVMCRGCVCVENASVHKGNAMRYPGVLPATGVQTIRTCTHYIRVKVIVCRQHWSIETIQWIHLLTSIFVCVVLIFFSSLIRVEPAYRPCWWPKGWAFVTFSLCTSCTGTGKHTHTRVPVILFIGGVLRASSCQ